jgi:hypothetical protein
MRASQKIADGLTSTPSRKPTTPPSSNEQRYLEGIWWYHDRNVKERSFNVGDLVLCRIQSTEGLPKLSSPWEGPFSISQVAGPGSYHLQTLEGGDISNSWNVNQLYHVYV